MNILEDTDLSNMTLDEVRAVATIMKSPRCGVLTKKLCEDIATTDAEAGVFLSNMVQSIVSCMMKRNADTIANMRNTVFMLGRNLTADRVKSGSRKGRPAFLTDDFDKRMAWSSWYTLAFIHDYANFKESARKVELQPDRFNQVTAKSVSDMNELTGCYVRHFREFLDDLEKSPLEELVSPMLFEQYPDMAEFIDWCRKNRDAWDDMEDT